MSPDPRFAPELKIDHQFIIPLCSCPIDVRRLVSIWSSGGGVRLRETHWHVLDSSQKVRAQPLDLASQLDLFCPFKERLQHQAKFKPCQMRTTAKMLTLAEGNMLVRGPPKVEGVRIFENLFVAI